MGMRLFATSVTGIEAYFEKLHKISRYFDNENKKALFHNNYGGNLILSVLKVISVYEEKALNQNLFDTAKNLERTKDIDGNPEITLIFNVLISPLEIEKLSIHQLRDLYCSLFIERINNPLFRIPKTVDYDQLKSDLLVLIEDLKDVDLNSIPL
ncbi:hypothetical protein ACG95N_09970 [Acinetobacter guillouiae]|uniref:hypothetical protein n=1 Tax=Acinetobacter guillouiae TaxID=106649 RepID=UPI003AF6C339